MEASPEVTRIGIAIVEHAGKYLVGVRGSDGPLAGFAEFPGGKCQPDETPAACAIRETLEETGLRISISEPFYECTWGYSHGSVALHFFLCRADPDQPVSDEHGGFAWVDALGLPELNFPPANQAVIGKLLDRQAGNSSERGHFG